MRNEQRLCNRIILQYLLIINSFTVSTTRRSIRHEKNLPHFTQMGGVVGGDSSFRSIKNFPKIQVDMKVIFSEDRGNDFKLPHLQLMKNVLQHLDDEIQALERSPNTMLHYNDIPNTFS